MAAGGKDLNNNIMGQKMIQSLSTKNLHKVVDAPPKSLLFGGEAKTNINNHISGDNKNNKGV